MSKKENIWKEYPNLVEQWDSSKNKDKSLVENTLSKRVNVWWKCNKGPDHEWEASISNRVGGRNCPFCGNRKPSVTNNLNNYPELVKEFDLVKNELSPDLVVAGGVKRFHWKCENGHSWEAAMRDRIKGGRCRKCSGKIASKDNNLKAKRSDISIFWDYEKNNKSPEEYLVSSNVVVNWKCSESDDHEWTEHIANMTANYKGCPFCSNHRVSKTNNLLKIHPQIAKEWHPTKNNDLSPDRVLSNSGKKVWWKCDKGADHEWPAIVNDRTPPNKKGCPVCSNHKKVKSNVLTATHPELLKEWDYQKNKKQPNEYVAGSDEKIHWVCNINPKHKWATQLNNRTSKKSGCPKCNIQGVSKQGLALLFEIKYIFSSTPIHEFKPKPNLTVDIFIKELNLIIEYDGHYYHKDRLSKDETKTKNLEELGFRVLRLREHPLVVINKTDIITPSYNLFWSELFNIVKSIFEFVLLKYPDLDENKQSAIKSYIEGGMLRNEEAYKKDISERFNQEDWFGPEIKKNRIENNISLEAIGKHLNIHPESIRSYENNKRAIDFKKYSEIINFIKSVGK